MILNWMQKKFYQKYLSEIKQMMGSEDVMYEIEARMVELFGERGVQNVMEL